MRDSSEATWWRKTWLTAATAVGVGIAIAFATLTFDAASGGPAPFGMPFGEFFGLVLAPLAILATAFVFAIRQRILDRSFDVAED